MEVRHGAGGSNVDVDVTGLREPVRQLGRSDTGSEEIETATHDRDRDGAQRTCVEQCAARQPPARPGNSAQLKHGVAGTWEAVQPGEADDEIELVIVELQGVDVGNDRLDLVLDTALPRRFPYPVQHRWRYVRGDVTNALARAKTPERHPTAAGDVQHRGSRRLLTNLFGGPMEFAEVAAEAQFPDRSPDPWMLDRPIVEVGPRRVLVPGTKSRRPWKSEDAHVPSLRPLRLTRCRGNLEAAEVMAMTSLLESTLDSEHRRIREFADAAETAASSSDEPRIRHRLSDTFSAVLSRHLAAVEDVLLPAARSSTAYGRESVRDYVRHVRVLEKVLHELKARVYGAATADTDWDELWREIDRHLVSLAQREAALAEQLRESLNATETRRLAHRFLAAEERAPTRPHAYTPHTGWRGRLAHRIWRIADGFWDEAEGRVIPHRPAKPPARPDSLMHRYMTGAPAHQPDES